MLSEEEMKAKAEQYLRDHYGEDTVRMDITNNTVEEGSGVMEVDITVDIAGSQSDWMKWFTFKDGEVTQMRWRMK